MTEVLALKNVSKEFGQGHTKVKALDDINITVNRGELIGVIGPSGSGKSTFLTVMAGLQDPTEGTVLVDGKDISKLSKKERVAMRFDKIGFILQSSNLVPFLTVAQQFQLIEKVDAQKKDEEYKQTLLSKLDIEDLKNQYPNDLSGGERQRVAIATALYHQPDIILADEPTASLDTDRAYEVVELLARQAEKQEKGILMVTHDERLLSYCHRVFLIEDGALTEETDKRKTR
ncbi:ABC transporter ATP-binding protein [Vagococcus lutrae]|uniref:ABC transporter ATP-binding protein n=1 Tax=Vagococcus lutrae TaxID=81947 RepID=UPI001C964CCC|nr:ABC transporter ATP-binding protein [Vagococcus lutrae]MDT2807220.1 ABC transporter ATP-binding protein [Vagococcus lutrae]QZN87994.1 ABC transporter ATP-binding protein [Vagococcus lutrae]